MLSRLLGNTTLRFGRILSRCRIGTLQAPAAARGAAAAVAPPLAVRAGVDPGGGREAPPPATKRPKREKKRPTHFLALQVSQHPHVRSAIEAVHAGIAQRAPHLEKVCVEAASAHLTLGVMALGSAEERSRAGSTLAALAAPLAQQALLHPVEVCFEGLSHFKNQVLYLDLKQDGGLEQLMRLAAATRAHFQESGLLLEADRAFVPHLTVAKTSKLQDSWGGRGHGRGRGHGGRRHGGRGGHDMRAERRGKQERQQREQEDEEALALLGSVGGEGAQQRVEAAAYAAAEIEPIAGVAGGATANATAQWGQQEVSRPPAMAAAHTQQAQQQQEQLDRRHIPGEAWAQHAGILGGPAVLAELQLCAMQGRKPGTYYDVIARLPLAPTAAAAAVVTGSGGSGEAEQAEPALSGRRHGS